MIPGAQKFFTRQPTQYEKALQEQVDGLRADFTKLVAEFVDLETSFNSKLDELRREMLGYIKPEAPKEEEVAPTGFRTFTQRRQQAAASGATQKVREVVAKTEQVLKQEKA